MAPSSLRGGGGSWVVGGGGRGDGEALMAVKAGFGNAANALADWDGGRDYCAWRGVACDANSFAVLRLVVVLCDTCYRVAGVGDIKIKMFDGVERMLRGVRHVPGLRRNLISLGVLHDGGMEFHCDRDKKTMKIMKDGVTLMMGERTASHLYKLQESTIAGGAMKSGAAGVAVESHDGGGLGPSGSSS